MDDRVVFTIGHSNRPIEEFIGLLKENQVGLLLDIRTVPRSRHNPQFNRDSLPDALAVYGIAYRHVAGLGGLRHPKHDSANAGWRNTSFRGYADYMQTPEFAANVDELARLSSTVQCVMMCAESVPWRCHRSMVADALVVRGIPVEHIMGQGKRKPHTLTTFAHVDGRRITYPPPDEAAASGQAALF